MTKQGQLILFATTLIILAGCNSKPNDPLSDPIVSIESNTLIKRELYEAIPDNMSKEDSIIFAKNYVDRWIKTQLILRKAELNLSPEEKDCDKLLRDYRTSLLTHLYQQKLLEQKYSPLITSSEIEAYYNQMRTNFKLKENIIKGVFIKISKEAPNIRNVENWYQSSRQEDLVNLEAYAFQNAEKFEPFYDHWIPFEQINMEFPNRINNQENALQWQKAFTATDASYNYYLSIRDVKFENTYAPLEYVSSKIKSILLNKKRIEFIENLEDDLYKEGENQDLIKFY